MLLKRLRKHATHPGLLDHYLVGPYAEPIMNKKRGHAVKASKYLALHLRFEIDMVAHSLCEFGGGEEERKELEAYREIHFPALTLLTKTAKYALLHVCFYKLCVCTYSHIAFSWINRFSDYR